MKNYWMAFVLFVSVFSVTMAQEKQVSGNVTDQNGLPLPGVSVVVVGTTTGTQTDFDGNYFLSASIGQVLRFSYLGQKTVERTIGNSTIVNIQMEEDAEALEEVVVTAQGIRRETRALGYAVQKVSSETIQRSNAQDPITALTGQAAGVQITNTSGSAGAGSRIVIRGQTTLDGDNQALIIVDGVRINNSQFNTEPRTAGVAGSNRGMDINPNDIESINVLKGAGAAALYGVEGGNGVIIITTKKGTSGKPKINVRSNVMFTSANKFAPLQNTFVQGSEGVWLGPETGESGSWGPSKENLFWDGSNYEYDRNGRIIEGGENGGVPFQPYDVYDVFTTGITTENSVSFSAGSEKTTFRFSYGDLNEGGIVPKNTFRRKTMNFAGSAKMNEKLNLRFTATYTQSNARRIQQGSNISGLMLGLLRTPISFDNSNGLDNPADNSAAYEFEDGTQRNYRGGGGYDNPYWTINNAPYTDEVNRLITSMGIDYSFADWLKFSATIGVDTYADTRVQFFDIGSRTNSAGAIFLDDYNYRHLDSYYNLNGDFDFGEDFSLGYLVGVNIYSEERTRNFTQGNDLGVKGFNNITNASAVIADYDLFREKNVGFYGQLNLAYKNWAYLTLTGRQDYLSTLENPQNFSLSDIALFYPSANLGIVFSEVFEQNDFLSFGKLRLSWAQVGAGAPDTYATTTAFEVADITDGWAEGFTFPFDGNAGFQINDDLGNTNLVPSTVTTQEIGLDLRFFKGRFSLDLAHYQRLAEDQILAVTIANSTGFNSSFLNSGELETTGYEAVLNAKIFNGTDFKWGLGINFDKSETIVNSLAEGVEEQLLGGFVIYNIPGFRYGQIYGGAFLRDDQGRILIEDDIESPNYGYQIADPELKVIGDPTPDFTIGFNNTFSWKDLTLNFLLEWKEGGEMWNGTDWALSFFGRSKLTEDRNETVVIEGVKRSNGATNDIPVQLGQFYHQSSGLSGFGSVDEAFVQSTSWLRLRTLNLNYDITRILKSDFFDSVSLSFTGNNLWLQTDYNGVDPETSLTGAGSNGQGSDYFNNPGTKSYGFGINLTF
ncbi:MAG: SusC/RagA family TonB-linked outer membrane protein [Bacteroidota bacterium]